MATLPPWLDRPNYVGAMQAGAQLGATLRAQDQAAQENAARLALQQDQINLEEKRLATTAAEALRRHNALEMFRQQQLELERQKAAELNAFRQSQLELRQSGREYGPVETMELSPHYTAAFRKGSPGLHVFPNTPNSTTSPNLTQRTQLDISKQEISDANREIASILKEPNFGPTDPNTEKNAERIKSLTDRISGLRSNMLQIASQGMPTNAPPAGLNLTPPPPSGTNAPTVGSFRGAERLRVKSPSGKIGTVPASELEQALKEGYTLIE